jgi:hypothetical protein
MADDAEKGCFSPRKRGMSGGKLVYLWVEIAEPQPDNAAPSGVKQSPNQLAAQANSRIMIAWLTVADKTSLWVILAGVDQRYPRNWSFCVWHSWVKQGNLEPAF